MDGLEARGRAARALAVLTVLFGLLAMHGVANAHHAASTPATNHAAVPIGEKSLVGTAPAEGPPHHRHAMPVADAVPAAGQDAAALAAPAGLSCDADCPNVAMLCVAVLTGAALALLLVRRRHPRLPLASTRHRARGSAPPVRRVRGPDPVRELCVNRT